MSSKTVYAFVFCISWLPRSLDCSFWTFSNRPFHVDSKNDRNGGIWQSGISNSLAEYIQRPVWFVNVQSSLHENVIFSVCTLMDNAASIYIKRYVS